MTKAKSNNSKRFSARDSRILVNKYCRFKGNWFKVLNSGSVKSLKRFENNCKNRIKYLIKLKNQKLSPNLGGQVRDEIINKINLELNKFDNDENLIINNFINNSETNNLINCKRIYNLNNVELSPLLDPLHQKDKEMLSEAINSDMFKNLDDIYFYLNKFKINNKNRNLKKLELNSEFNNLLNLIRKDKIFNLQEDLFDLNILNNLLLIYFNLQQSYFTFLQDCQNYTFILNILLYKITNLKINKNLELFLFILNLNNLFTEEEDLFDDCFNNINNLLFLLLNNLFTDELVYLFKWEIMSLFTNKGISKGVYKNKRIALKHKNVYKIYKNRPLFFKENFFITEQEFDLIINDLNEYRNNLEIKSKYKLTLENKVIIGFLFVMQYNTISQISMIFNCSNYLISKILDKILLILAFYFLQFIENKFDDNCQTSKLHSDIIGIVDNTITKTKKPAVGQRHDYNSHYLEHGKLTSILMDYSKKIIAFTTMIPGSFNDYIVSVYNELFNNILKNKYAIRDSAFNHSQYIVAGFKSKSIKTAAQRVFDKISRFEQSPIEHLNSHLKDCKSIGKEGTFIHSNDRLMLCLMISMGFYNLKHA
ncbi:hypothetical protein ABK040_014691 [Willaertia magna]